MSDKEQAIANMKSMESDPRVYKSKDEVPGRLWKEKALKPVANQPLANQPVEKFKVISDDQYDEWSNNFSDFVDFSI